MAFLSKYIMGREGVERKGKKVILAIPATVNPGDLNNKQQIYLQRGTHLTLELFNLSILY